MTTMDLSLLEKLIAVQGVSSDEGQIAAHIQAYIEAASHEWKVQPTIIKGDGFQDAFIVVFGKPRTAVYAHTDTIGFSVGYGNDLIKVGGPRIIDGTQLVGVDSLGPCSAELVVYEYENGELSIQYVSDRTIDRGTLLSFKPDFRLTETTVQTPYLDNRLGVWVALELMKTMTDGAIVFSTYEEHGGNTAGTCAKYLLDTYSLRQALICDITWITHGVVHGGGVAISMRDSMLPRRSYLNRILAIAEKQNIQYQLEVESAGGSDGSVLQKSDLAIDWCFIGAPEDNVHTPNEIVHLSDIQSMVELYRVLLKEL